MQSVRKRNKTPLNNVANISANLQLLINTTQEEIKLSKDTESGGKSSSSSSESEEGEKTLKLKDHLKQK